MVPSLAFVGSLVVDSQRSKFHVADPNYTELDQGISVILLLSELYTPVFVRIMSRLEVRYRYTGLPAIMRPVTSK